MIRLGFPARFNSSGAFTGALTASDRRFQLSQLDIQRRQSEAAIADLNATIERGLAEQQKIVELQGEYLSALEQAVRIQTEAQEDFQEFSKEETKTQTDKLEKLNKSVESFDSNFKSQVEEIKRRLDNVLGVGPVGTAGGPVGRVSRFGSYVTGQVWSTGDVKLWHRHDFPDDSGVIRTYVPAGWLICDGTSFEQTQYPELAFVLGGTYLGSNPGGYWLPAKSDLTDDAMVLGNPKLDFLIRT